MKLILDIQESKAPFFLELIDGLKYVQIVKKIDDEHKSREMQNIVDAFNDAILHEKGKKSLKTANQLLDEL
jgi:hypothetical protein